MIKKDNKKIKKLWLATALTLGLTTTPVMADSVVTEKTVIQDPVVGSDLQNAATTVSTVEEAKVLLENTKEALELSEEALAQAEKDHDTLSKTVETAKNDTENAQKDVDDELEALLVDAENSVAAAKEKETAAKKAWEAADKENTDAQAEYDSAIAKEKEAQSKYDKLIAESSDIEGDVADCEAKVKETQSKIEEAEVALGEAEDMLDEAKTELSKSKAVFDKATEDLQTLENTYEDAKKTALDAEKQVNDCKAELMQYEEGSDAYIGLLEKIETAETELETAKLDVASIEADVAKKGEILNQAQNNYDQIVQNTEMYKKLVAEREQALQELKSADQIKEECKAAYEKVSADVSNQEKALEAAKTELTKAQEQTTLAKAALDTATATLNATEEKYAETREAAKKAVADAEATYENAGLDYVLSRCLKYKDSNGQAIDSYTVWMNVMKKNEDLAPYLNEEFEKTIKEQFSVENLKSQMTFIDECNELRAREGEEPLAVDYDLMLFSAISNAISTQAGYTEGHLLVNEALSDSNMRSLLLNACGGLFSENLSYGYADPYDGWYDKEKALYDEGERRNEKVGHYLNIKNNDYNITGFAMNSSMTAEQSFGYCHGATLTTGEFISRLEDYAEKAKEVLDAAKEALNAITREDIKAAEADVAKKTEEYNEAAAAENIADKLVDDAVINLENTTAAAEQAKIDYEKAALDYDSKEAAYEKSKETVEKFAGEHNLDSAAAYDLLEKAELDVLEVKAELEIAKGLYESKSEAVADAKGEMDVLYAKAAELNKELKAAEEIFAEAEAKRQELQNEYGSKKEAVETAAQKHVEAESEVDSKERVYNDTKAAVESLSKQLETDILEHKTKKEQATKVSEAKEEMNHCQVEAASKKELLSEAIESAQNALTEYETAQKTVIEAEAELEKVKAIDCDISDSYSEYPSVNDLMISLNKAKEQLAEAEGNLERAVENKATAEADYEKARKAYELALANYSVLKNTEENNTTEEEQVVPDDKVSQHEKHNKEDNTPQTSDDFSVIPGMAGLMGSLLVAGAAMRRREN